MAILSGVIAYRASVAEQLRDEIHTWKTVYQDEAGKRSKSIACPDCGELYLLMEEAGVSDQLLEQDETFLGKALGSANPGHVACLAVRDPEGTLRDYCDQLIRTLEKKVA
jgi:hypothetical protein